MEDKDDGNNEDDNKNKGTVDAGFVAGVVAAAAAAAAAAAVAVDVDVEFICNWVVVVVVVNTEDNDWSENCNTCLLLLFGKFLIGVLVNRPLFISCPGGDSDKKGVDVVSSSFFVVD